ncbi:RNA polymerase sigma factor RpoD/SigA [Pedobacter nyackensis]|uniref:sigma-70 family RNA polymerase sigma factor n=1 Tax=Pedobacter nyackensis TaxID=475255 RepID=UPI00292E3E70|nr:RNA polymerase sigma factor RpoD/SigA [Pedobacter nyackensis]
MRALKIGQSITNRSHASLQRYLSDIAKYNVLSVDEEIALARKIKAGDQAAFQRLINSNLRFVVSVAKKYEGQGLSLPDLVSIGNLGLVKAAERFDETKGFKFISFAVWWIRQSIMHTIGEQRRMIRRPTNQRDDIFEVYKAQDYLEQQLERMPTPDELSEYTGIAVEKVKDYLMDSPFGIPLESDEEEEKPGLLSFLEDHTFSAPDKQIELEGRQQSLDLMIGNLTEREARILRMYYGLNNDTPMLLEDIATNLGLSKESIRRSKSIAIKRLNSDQKLRYMQQYITENNYSLQVSL